jgi:hypothetical protein
MSYKLTGQYLLTLNTSARGCYEHTAHTSKLVYLCHALAFARAV